MSRIPTILLLTCLCAGAQNIDPRSNQPPAVVKAMSPKGAAMAASLQIIPATTNIITGWRTYYDTNGLTNLVDLWTANVSDLPTNQVTIYRVNYLPPPPQNFVATWQAPYTLLESSNPASWKPVADFLTVNRTIPNNGAAMYFRLLLPSTNSVPLFWDYSKDSTVVGYDIWQGGVSGAYTNVTVLGNTNAFVASNLKPGLNYYFSATTHNSAGVRSPYSNEVFFSPPTNSWAIGTMRY